jgi:hypothetical protein
MQNKNSNNNITIKKNSSAKFEGRNPSRILCSSEIEKKPLSIIKRLSPESV